MILEGVIRPRPLDQKVGWFVVGFDSDLSKYYSKLSGIPWLLPKNGVHVTIVAGQHEPRLITDDEMFQWIGLSVNCYTDATTWTNTESFWMNVLSDELNKLRATLGLPSRNFHLTLGNLKNVKTNHLVS